MFTHNTKNEISDVDNILNYIVNALNRDSPLAPLKEDFLASLDKSYPKWSSNSKLIIDELEKLVDETPQEIFNVVRMSRTQFGGIYSLRKYATLLESELIPPGQQIEILAVLYENATILKIIAYLVSGRRAHYKSMNNQEKVLSYFRFFDFSSSDKNLFRLLRNAKSHKPEFRNDKFLLETGEEVSINEIDILFKKVKDLFEYTSEIITKSTFYIPKIGLYSSIHFYQNKEEIEKIFEEYEKGFEFFYPHLKEKEDFEKKKIEKEENSLFSFVKEKFIAFGNNILSKVGFSSKPDSEQNSSFILSFIKAFFFVGIVQCIPFVGPL